MKVFAFMMGLCLLNVSSVFAGKAAIAALILGAAALKGSMGKFIPIPLVLPLPIPFPVSHHDDDHDEHIYMDSGFHGGGFHGGFHGGFDDHC